MGFRNFSNFALIYIIASNAPGASFKMAPIFVFELIVIVIQNILHSY
jgi:hypothetical protein